MHAPSRPERRYQYRIFSDDLARAAAQLGALATAVERRASNETYFVAKGRNDVNLKIRDQRLELKRRQLREGRFELWEAGASLDLPAKGRDVRQLAREALAIDIAVADDRALSEAALVDLASACASLTPVRIRKDRLLYTLVGARAEHTSLTIDGRRFETIAVEGEDLVRLAGLIDRPEFVNRRSAGYPAFLRQLISEAAIACAPMRRLPEEASRPASDAQR